MTRRASIKQVELALTRTDLSDAKAAALVGYSEAWVNKVRRGRLHAQLFPHLPRRTAPVYREPAVYQQGRTCDQCKLVDGERCSLRFPEFTRASLRAAAKCPAFFAR
ncbi:MAG: hypothetical protein AAFX65_07425 [Cyanobacteria bacterium J06638_7]